MAKSIEQFKDRWYNYQFESSISKTPEFKRFAREYKALIRSQLITSFNIVQWNTGHFYVSGFLQHRYTGKYIYFSVSDVRHFVNDWYNKILIRRAKHDTDYTGGTNYYTDLSKLYVKCTELILDKGV